MRHPGSNVGEQAEMLPELILEGEIGDWIETRLEQLDSSRLNHSIQRAD
jgi:hypothetical protein